MKLSHLTAVIGAAGLLALPSISAAKTIDVGAGQSIQRAVNRADSGDTINGAGTGNRFRHNHCDTSQPSELCE